MNLIYEPKGRAREYSPLALNVYTGGCDHRCAYCYCKAMQRGAWGDAAKPRKLHSLEKNAKASSRQVLLSFLSDPYCLADAHYENTRIALSVLKAAGCSVALLTKGGTRCLRDMDMFMDWPDNRIKVGATLTSVNAAFRDMWEPGAASPMNRIEALKHLHERGVKTWASFEPVIDTNESLAAMDMSLPYVDEYNVGRWNGDRRANAIDWGRFGFAAVRMLRAAGKRLYVKADLRMHLPDGYLTAEEMDQDALTLPDRPMVAEANGSATAKPRGHNGNRAQH